MSRHHTLPPIIYTPPEPTKLKDTKRKRGIRGAWQTGDADAADETSDSGHPAPTIRLNQRPLGTPIEAAERRDSGSGRLSSDTLRAMLELQEVDDGETPSAAVPTSDT
jgi:hypothetical protein